VIDGVFRAGFDTRAAFDTLGDIHWHRFRLVQLIDFRRTNIDAIAMANAFIIIDLNRNIIAAPFFQIHTSSSVTQPHLTRSFLKKVF
jgi:hypothetical protein